MTGSTIPRAAVPALTRQTWVVAHRWAGLTLALFLTIVGATGALLPWYQELTLMARPQLSRAAPPRPGARPLDGVTLAGRVEQQTGARVGYIDLAIPRTHVALVYVRPAGATPLAFDTVWADPYTGAVRLTYRNGVLADGPQSIMAFLYRVHYELALGRVGTVMLGVAALVWTLDCFVGLYLTFPLRRRPLPGGTAPHARGPGPRAASWWRRWRPAWLVRWAGGPHRLTFDLHRAGGLWIWPMLLVFAWSSVGFNLREVHDPVMRLFGAAAPAVQPVRAVPLAVPPIGLRAAQRRGDALLRGTGAAAGFRVGQPSSLLYDPGQAVYRYQARTTLDVMSEGGATAVVFSAIDGRLLRFVPPVPANRADAVTTWLQMLHLAQVFGMPYRVFVSTMGIIVVMLSVTGVLVWTRKRSARLLGRSRRGRTEAAGVPLPAATA